MGRLIFLRCYSVLALAQTTNTQWRTLAYVLLRNFTSMHCWQFWHCFFIFKVEDKNKVFTSILSCFLSFKQDVNLIFLPSYPNRMMTFSLSYPHKVTDFFCLFEVVVEQLYWLEVSTSFENTERILPASESATVLVRLAEHNVASCLLLFAFQGFPKPH